MEGVECVGVACACLALSLPARRCESVVLGGAGDLLYADHALKRVCCPCLVLYGRYTRKDGRAKAEDAAEMA